MDLDKLLRDSLKKTGDGYRPEQEAEARRTFMRRARKRRLLAGSSLALAGAAMATLALLIVASPGTVEAPADDEGDVATIPETRVAATVGVGRRPVAVVVGAGFVWVGNAQDQSISKLDPDTDEVVETYELDGVPAEIEVAGDEVWVALEDEARLVSIGVADGKLDDLALAGGGTNIDMAAEGEDAWVVSPDTPLQRIDTSAGRAIEQSTVSSAVDIAVGQSKVWLLDASGGIEKVDQQTGLSEGVIPLDQPVSATASDLAVDATGLWVADGDSRAVFRVDFELGERTAEVPFTGRFADLHATDDGRVWMLTGNSSDEGEVKVIDSATGAVASGEIMLDGDPVDQRFGGGALWVVGAASAEVTRIETGAVFPSPTPAVDDPIDPDELLYVYTDEGDLYSVTGDGDSEALTQTPEADDNPSFTSDGALVFERAAGGAVTVMEGEPTGAAQPTGAEGTEVSVGPGDQIALVPPGGGSEQTKIRIGSLDGDGTDSLVGNPDFEALTVRNLEWDPTGAKLYYEAGIDRFGLYELEVGSGDVGSIDPPESEADYLAPSAQAAGEVVAIKVCCRGEAGTEVAELGRITLDDERGHEYTKIAGLDDFGFDASSADLTVEYAGGLDVETSPDGPVWTETAVPAWFVSDGAGLWLIDEQGEIDRLEPTGIIGLAVAPQFTE